VKTQLQLVVVAIVVIVVVVVQTTIKTNNRSSTSGMEGMIWFNLAQVKDRWGALVNAVMNFRVP
jgi:hypothetical protein